MISEYMYAVSLFLVSVLFGAVGGLGYLYLGKMTDEKVEAALNFQEGCFTGKEEGECWQLFLDMVHDRLLGEVNLAGVKTLGMLYSTLIGQIEKVPAGLTFYYTYHGYDHRQNHISMVYYEGASEHEIAKIGELSLYVRKTVWYLTSTWDVQDISAILLQALVGSMPSTGVRLKPFELTAIRKKNWTDHRGDFKLYHIDTDKATCPRNQMGKEQITDTKLVQAYLNGSDIFKTDNISFMTAILFNYLAIGNKNEDKFYFRALGCPDVMNHKVYYTSPAEMSNGDIAAGCIEPFFSLVKAAVTAKSCQSLGRMCVILSDFGFPMLTSFTFEGSTSGVKITKYLAEFAWGGGFMDDRLDDSINVKVRDDIQVIIGWFAKKKLDNKKAGVAAEDRQLKLKDVNLDDLNFFGVTGPKYLGSANTGKAVATVASGSGT